MFYLVFVLTVPRVKFSFVIEQVKQHGISVFLMPSGMLGTLLSLIDVLPLFSNTAWGQSANIDFLKNHMGATFEKRPQPWRATIDPEDVHSGDFLAVSKIRGRWGGFETLEKWVTGAFAGHTAVCLKDEEGNLWVGESGHENEKVCWQFFITEKKVENLFKSTMIYNSLHLPIKSIHWFHCMNMESFWPSFFKHLITPYICF